MSDDQLRAACASSSLKIVGAFWFWDGPGCLLWLVIVALSDMAGAWIMGGVVTRTPVANAMLSSFLALAFPVGIGILSGCVVHRRRAPFRKELRRRYGMSKMASYIDEERREMLNLDAPAWSVLLMRQCLPPGGHEWVRVRLWKTPVAAGRVEIRSVQWGGGAHDIEKARVCRIETALSENSMAPILAFLENELPVFSDVRPLTLGRSSCRVAIIHEERVHKFTCALDGLTTEQKDLPSVRFAEALRRAGGQDVLRDSSFG